MQLNGMPGEYGFKALHLTQDGWRLTDEYFFSWEDLKQFIGQYQNKGLECWKWPVEVNEFGGVYVPSKEELE